MFFVFCFFLEFQGPQLDNNFQVLLDNSGSYWVDLKSLVNENRFKKLTHINWQLLSTYLWYFHVFFLNFVPHTNRQTDWPPKYTYLIIFIVCLATPTFSSCCVWRCTFSRSKGCVQQAAPALARPPKYQRAKRFFPPSAILKRI